MANEIKVGDVVALASAPARALVRDDGQIDVTMTPQSADFFVTVVALNVPADATADDLCALAECFETCEASARMRAAGWRHDMTARDAISLMMVQGVIGPQDINPTTDEHDEAKVAALAMQVEHIDYNEPPPKYVLETLAAVEAAWVHYKRHNDPPGLRIWCDVFTGDDVWWFGTEEEAFNEGDPTEVEARAAAWAWYDRRHALEDANCEADIRAGWPSFPSIPWPECLAWTDEQVAEVERWHKCPSGSLPEVMRRGATK